MAARRLRRAAKWFAEGNRRAIRLRSPGRGEGPLPAAAAPPAPDLDIYAQGVRVVCTPRTLLGWLGLEGNVARGLEDLSVGGAQLVCSRKLQPGQKVELRLEFKQPKVTVVAQGEVRSCKPDPDALGPRWFAGIAFTAMGPEDRQRLEEVASACRGGGPAL